MNGKNILTCVGFGLLTAVELMIIKDVNKTFDKLFPTPTPAQHACSTLDEIKATFIEIENNK